MISICIPVYNYDAGKLIEDLVQQAISSEINIEINILNDGSGISFTQIMRSWSGGVVNYFEFTNNAGRVHARNLLISKSNFENILFLDCDVQLIFENYLESYVQEIIKGYQVITGGTVYQKSFPGKQYSLHWAYGHYMQKNHFNNKDINPYRSFMTNNFLIQKDISKAIGFNESIKNYGHEDTIFGFELEKRNIGIKHINNPVLHASFDTNEIFLAKTRQSVENLSIVNNILGEKNLSNISLIQFYKKIKRYKLMPLFKISTKVLMPIIHKLLIRGKGGIKMLQFYKLLAYVKSNTGEQNL